MRVQVSYSGLAGNYRGEATYAGKDSYGEDVYRVIFGSPGYEHSALFRQCDLNFEQPTVLTNPKAG
jgi:hypothetical protein